MQFKETWKQQILTFLTRFLYLERLTGFHASHASQLIIGSKHWKTPHHYPLPDLLNLILYQLMDFHPTTSTSLRTTNCRTESLTQMTRPVKNTPSWQVKLPTPYSTFMHAPVQKKNYLFVIATDYIGCYISSGKLEKVGDPNKDQMINRRIEIQNLK